MFFNELSRQLWSFRNFHHEVQYFSTKTSLCDIILDYEN
jgi:hypothetical protein